MKLYRINLIVKSKRTVIILGANNAGDAFSTARKMYPNDQVIGVTPCI